MRICAVDVEAKAFGQLTQWGISRSELIAVAFSGGGDSTALLSLMIKWNNAQSVQAFIVDHGLRSGSDTEAELARSRAHEMGASARILSCAWPNEKPGEVPTTGIQEKARNARYQLLGDACREQGIKTLMLGHNRGDQAETVLMRQQAGSGWRGLAGIKCRIEAPIWPALQGVEILRLLLEYGRAELRSYNKNNGLTWIDDPSNDSQAFARIRARAYLDTHLGEKQNLLTMAKAANFILAQEQVLLSEFIQSTTRIHDWGGVNLLPGFCTAKLGQVAEALKYLLPAISGDAFPPSTEKRMNLARRFRAKGFSGATLGGVRCVPQEGGILCVRDLGVLLGRAKVPAVRSMQLQANETKIWDSRFAITTIRNNVTVDALGNWVDKLDKSQKLSLSSCPQVARGGLPVFVLGNQVKFIPPVVSHADNQDFSVRTLTNERLRSLLSEFD
ncbi:MAG: tRNA lysidine(34) synthetase TilS [Robiginitomaculum sp.]|nr:tRNA lysidine(34) synthetase TilS [Robiginitomaculum sp.]